MPNYIQCQWKNDNDKQCRKKAITTGFLFIKVCKKHKYESNLISNDTIKWINENKAEFRDKVQQGLDKAKKEAFKNKLQVLQK